MNYKWRNKTKIKNKIFLEYRAFLWNRFQWWLHHEEEWWCSRDSDQQLSTSWFRECVLWLWLDYSCVSFLTSCCGVQAGRRSRRCQRCDESQVLHLNQLAGRDWEKGTTVLLLLLQPGGMRGTEEVWCLTQGPCAFLCPAGSSLQAPGDVRDRHALLWWWVHSTNHHNHSPWQM